MGTDLTPQLSLYSPRCVKQHPKKVHSTAAKTVFTTTKSLELERLHYVMQSRAISHVNIEARKPYISEQPSQMKSMQSSYSSSELLESKSTRKKLDYCLVMALSRLNLGGE